jgi:electron transfer flavoprotein beta subunit
VKILVTAKRVTDPDAKIRLKADLSDIETEGLEFKINPFCENAIEEAVRIKEKNNAEIVVVSLGPTESDQYIRTALAMGGDRGIRIDTTDKALDGDLVARTIVAIAKAEKPDLILLGKQAVDGDSNQVGQLVAEYLGIGQATFANKVDLDADGLTVRREVDGGLETLKCKFPCVVTADLRLNEPRYPALPKIMQAKRKPLDVKTFADYGVDPGLKVKTLSYGQPPSRKAGVKVPDVDTLVGKLKNEAKVIG